MLDGGAAAIDGVEEGVDDTFSTSFRRRGGAFGEFFVVGDREAGEVAGFD